MRVHKRTALVAVLSLVLAACAGSTAETTTTAGESVTTQGTEAPDTTDAPTTTVGTTAATEVTIGLQLEPPTLDLTSSPAAAIPQVLLYNVYETLVRLQPDGSITGLLASDWEVSDDGLTYTFYLREGATFHNGEPLTAEDVVFSINNVINKDPAHPFATTFAPITSVEAPDQATAVITVSQVSANLLFFLTQGQGVILEESAIGDIENTPVGSGPFTFDSWTVGDSIVLSRNDAYWGEPAILETVTFRYINDPSALTNAMLAGDIDVLAGVSAPETLETFGDGEFRIEEGETYGEIVLSLNGRRAPFDNVLVRQAVSHAIDRQAIVDLAYAGYGTVIGSFASPLEPWYKDLSGVYPYDVQAAQDLMDEAGVGEVTIEMILPPISYAGRSGEIIASQLAEIGITVNITNVEWGVWLEDVFANYDFDMSIVSHVEPRDLAQYGNPDYYWGNDSPEVADLLAQADAEPDEAARNALYQQVLDGITEVAADNWLFVLPALAVTKTGISGYKIDLPGSLDVTELALNE
jgi:peptide/nickel transport system substrate-binding protein